MAITAANAAYVSGNAPTVSGEAKVGQSELDFVLVGQATLTLDGTLTAGDVNWIDGTKTISPTPTKVFLFRIGGTALASISMVSATAIGNAKFTATFSAAGTASNTLIFAFFACR